MSRDVTPRRSTTLHLSPPLVMVQREAAAMGISFAALLTADIVRYRSLAAGAAPPLTAREAPIIGHVLDGIEAASILTGSDDLPSAARIAAEITEWADRGVGDTDLAVADDLASRAAAWPPLAVAGILMRGRRR